MRLLLSVNTITDKDRLKKAQWNVTNNWNFWEISPVITTFDMSKFLAMIFQVWYPPWLILRFSVRPKAVLVGPPIPKKCRHIGKNTEVEVMRLFSMIFLATSDSEI